MAVILEVVFKINRHSRFTTPGFHDDKIFVLSSRNYPPSVGIILQYQLGDVN
jgi:hypothetical protein